MKRILFIVVAIALLAGGAIWYAQARSTSTGGFRTVPVKAGNLVATISATGTVEPEEVVDVGAQVAGQILEFGQDKNGKQIDYGSTVEAGTILARIDPAVYESDVASANAQVQQAQAGVHRAAADLEQMKAKLTQADRDWQRAQNIDQSNALAQTQYDAYKAAFDSAKATVDVGDASLEQAKSAVAQAQANLDRATRNLGYATIKSPVKGVIVDRRVNIGQTVVASLNAPSLFLMAKDLTRMQVWVSVNEADIGHIHPGQPVTFTVDAYPGQTFKGQVGKIRLNASMTQNVVTYTVEVNTDNRDGKLLPYLTANVSFQVATREKVLMVPNAALRWLPVLEQVVPEARDQQQPQRGTRRGSDSAASGPATHPADGGDRPRPGIVWVPQGELVRPIYVQTGITDGTDTEVHSDQLKESMEVVVGEQRADGGANQSKNPFAPNFGSRPRGVR